MSLTGVRLAVAAAVLSLGLFGCPESPPVGAGGGGGGGGLGGGAGGGPGGPTAQLSASSLDFQQVGCGAAPAERVLTLSNAGGSDLTFSAAVNATGVYAVSPASGTVAPGASAMLTVSATVAAATSAGATQSGTLTVATNDPAHASTAVPLTLVASGAALSLTPALAAFGLLPVNTQAPAIPLTLTNVGNAPATITLAAPGDTQFSLTWDGAPAVVTLNPGESVTGLGAGFRPSTVTPSSSAAQLTVAGSVCGASVTSIPMTGQGTNGQVGFSTTDVFFGVNGLVDCGAQAASQTFSITNSGNQAFSWVGTLGKGSASPFTFSPTSGTVPANGGSMAVTVTPMAAVPAEASTAPDAFGDLLFIATDVANDTGHAVLLHQTARGAVLTVNPMSVDFGEVPVSRRSDAPIAVANDGNAPALISLSSDNPRFTLAPMGPSVVAGGNALALTATFAPGTSVLPESATVTLAVDAGDVLCAPLPQALTLSGQGTNGSVSYTPAALDYGLVDCGTTAAARSVTFTNGGNQAYTLSAALGRGGSSPFAVELTPDSGVAEPDGGTVVLTVTPAAIPQTSAVTPNLYGDTLTVTTDVVGDSAHDIPLRLTARGSIFAISTNSLSFGSVVVGQTGSSQFSVTNTGNAAGALDFTAGQPQVFGLPQNATVQPNATAAQVGSFSPAMAGSFSDTATVAHTSATVLCQPLPITSMALSGTGSTGNVLALSATSLTFGAGGLVPCGSQASSRTISVTNNASNALTLAYALGGGTASPYTVSGPATISAGGTATVTVSPGAIPATASTAPDAFADTLSLTATGGAVNETRTVALHETAQGAVLSFNPTALSWTASGSKNFTMNNTGNLAAPYSLSLGGANPGNWTVSPTAATAGAGASVSEAATYSRPLLGGARTATVSVTTSATLCAPLPAALSLSGT